MREDSDRAVERGVGCGAGVCGRMGSAGHTGLVCIPSAGTRRCMCKAEASTKTNGANLKLQDGGIQSLLVDSARTLVMRARKEIDTGYSGESE
jgi:hypothetical protein